MPKNQNYCHTVTKTAEIFEKKHMITLLGIFIIDGPGYFLELSRKLRTDKKTLQERLKILLHHWLIQQELQMKGKVKKSLYSVTEKGKSFVKVMDSIYEFGLEL